MTDHPHRSPTAEPTPTATPSTDAQQLALLVDTVREYAIYMLDAGGVIRTWNPGAQRIKGYAPVEVIGQHFSRMFTAEDRDAGVPQRLLAEAEREGFCRHQGWRVRKDGTRFWASVVITAMRDRAGALTGFAKVSRDETERHALEEQTRRHADELEARVEERTRELQQQAATLRRMNEELEQFNYITSHDLQEPIRMVAMYMQKLIQQGGNLSRDQQRFARYALEGAERMRMLINDLLRYNRIDRDQETQQTTASGAALQAAIDNLAQTVAARRAEIRQHEMPLVLAHPGQLTQVFQNLIENAIKYGPERGAAIDISATRDGAAWCFRVRDNGIGIDPQYHERIFQVFQRLHGRDQYPGTGMGLAICKKVIERHGGRIWVESAAGAGSSFLFTLPAI